MVIHGCNSVVKLKPNIILKSIFKGGKKENLRLIASLKSIYTEKGCGRDTYDPSSLYRKCGVNKILELLPSTSNIPTNAYTKYLPSKTSSKGNLIFLWII